MKTIHITLYASLAMINTALCMKPGIDNELFDTLKRTAHSPSYEGLVFDRKNVRDLGANLQKGAHKPNYTQKVTDIDHEGETLTIETKDQKKTPSRSGGK